jgi:hypothetical protein
MNAKGFFLSLVVILGSACISCGSLAQQSADHSNTGSSSIEGTKAGDLIPYIEAQQKAHVRESTGIYAYQCFTEVDLGRFKADSVHLKLAREARQSPRFRAIVAQLRTLPEEPRKAILAEARSVGHPTWAQLGRITTDGSGQTEAGQVAEKLIAGAIVHATEELLVELDR